MTFEPGGGERRLMAQRVLGETLRLLAAHFGTLFALALAPALLMEAAFLLISPPLVLEADVEAGSFPVGIYWAALLSSLAGQVVVALVTLAGIDCAAGQSRSLDSYVRIVLRNLVPIVLVGMGVSLAAGFGAMFFVLPGIYIYAVFFVWLPCILFEGLGFGALARAQALTRGHRWPLMGAIASLILIFIGAIVLLGPVWATLAGDVGSILAALISAALTALSYAVLGIFSGLIYLRLRYLEDGTTPEQVASAI